MTGFPPRERAQAALTIDLRALALNWRTLRDKVQPAQCAAVVKADAYGIGLEQAVVALSGDGCASFFVAHPDEGLRARAALRKAGAASATIVVLNGFAAQQAAAADCAEADLTPMLNNDGDMALWRDEAGRWGRQLAAGLMFDTGMNRLGFDWRAAQPIAERCANIGAFDLTLAASHFVSSENPADPLNALQIERFESVRRAFPGLAASLANSSGVFLPQQPWLDMVRPGYALYGGNPCPGKPNPMRPVVRLCARILQLREIGAGESVGYNGQWTARRAARLAAIGLGYADGLPRNAMATDAKLGGEAIVAGRRCPFAGRISMDIAMIDVTDVPEDELAPGMEIELLGDAITIDDLGARAQTIGYEILTNLGRRYAREYVG